MAEFSRLVITNKGQALLAKMMTGEADVEFTKISVSDKEYTLEELNMLTELTGVKQTAPVAKITRTNNVAITIETSFDNTELTQGYYMRALGLYAIDPDDGEILYAVTTELAGCCYMPAYNGITISGACIKLVTTVGNAENVSLEVDPGVYATVGEIKELRECVDGFETWKDNTQKRLDNWGPTIVGHGQVINSLRDSIGNLKPVATSGDYNDLSNRPSIPAAVRVKGNAELEYRTGDINLTPANIGLGNVNDTSDVNKPVSIPQRIAIDAKISKSGDTISGNLEMTNHSINDVLSVNGSIGKNKYWKIIGGNTGYLEIATADDGTVPIYVRQYTGVFDNVTHEICLLDENGETTLNGDVFLKKRLFFGNFEDCNYITNNLISTGEKGYYIWISEDNDQFSLRSQDSYIELVFEPYNNKDINLGSTDYKWTNIYADNGTIQTSDRNAKNTIKELPAKKAQQLIYGLKPSTYKMNIGTSGRTHWGLVSQDIEELFEEIGMTSLDFAGFIKSPKIQRIRKDENGKKLQEPLEKIIESEYDYSLRYDEFIAPIIKVIQSQHEEIETLKQETAVLKRQLSDLMKRETV